MLVRVSKLAGAGADGSGGEVIRYYAVVDPQGSPQLVWRWRQDDVKRELTPERWTPDGWVDDPSLIDELREPSNVEISESKAEQIIMSNWPEPAQ